MPALSEERTTSQREVELSGLVPPTAALHAIRDRDLLLAGRRARIRENEANAERWLCLVEFYRRRLVTEEDRRSASPHLALTARQETVVEIGSLWGLDAARVRKELNVALFLCQHASGIWELCQSGQLDGYRATLVADAARAAFARDDVPGMAWLSVNGRVDQVRISVRCD